jgi:hypothetical protein
MRGGAAVKKTFFALVERTDRWDQSKPAPEQDGFAGHAAYMHGLEDEGVIAQAGLLQDSFDVIFLLHADSADEVRERFAQDPWQREGRTRLVRVEEAQFRIGAPAQA